MEMELKFFERRKKNNEKLNERMKIKEKKVGEERNSCGKRTKTNNQKYKKNVCVRMCFFLLSF